LNLIDKNSFFGGRVMHQRRTSPGPRGNLSRRRIQTEGGSSVLGPCLVEKLNQVRAQVHDTKERIEEICLTYSEYSYLLTIPGFGPYISAKLLAAISDPFRFKYRNQVLKLAGYDLCANRSGKTSSQAVPVISKNGNSELRYALYQAAHVAASANDTFRAYFTKMLQGRAREKGIKTKMKVKLAAKMLVIAWTLMKRKEVFDPAHLNID